MTNSTAIDMLAPDNWAYPSSTPVSPYPSTAMKLRGAMLFEVEQQMVGEWLETVVLLCVVQQCADCGELAIIELAPGLDMPHRLRGYGGGACDRGFG